MPNSSEAPAAPVPTSAPAKELASAPIRPTATALPTPVARTSVGVYVSGQQVGADQIKKRAERVKARRMMEKTGAATKGDGKDVDHIKPMRSGGTSAKGNLRMRSKSANRADNK